MRLLRNLKLLISEGDTGDLCLFNDDGQLARTETLATFIDRANSGRLSLDNADGLVSVPFGDVGTAKAILLAPNLPINFRINGGTVDLPIAGGTTTEGRGMLYWEGDITEIRVENPDAVNAASVLYAIVGVG